MEGVLVYPVPHKKAVTQTWLFSRHWFCLGLMDHLESTACPQCRFHPTCSHYALQALEEPERLFRLAPLDITAMLGNLVSEFEVE